MSDDGAWKVGTCYLIRTVTMYTVGRLMEVYPQELVLADAAWVADTGRFGRCLLDGIVAEAEPWPDGRVIVGRGAVVDACVWPHASIRSPK